MTAEQAAHIGEAMKDIDKKKPAEAAETLRQISEYLDTSTTISDKFKRTWSETIAPILKANNAILELEKNVKAAGEATSALSTTLMNMQAGSIVNVGNAKRDFDQIKAIGLDAAEKIKEFNVQANQKSSQDGVDREKEKAAFANKTNAERINAEKDFYKAQQETYYAQQLSNEATDRSLRAQVSINKLKLEQLDSINYEKILEESRVNNVVKEQNALLANVELRRKNLITADELKKLDEQAHENRLTNDKIAQQDAERIQKTNERNIRIQIEGLDMANKERLKSLQLEESSFGLSTRQQAFQKQLLDLQNARTRAIKDLNNNAALSDQEKLDALIGINEQYQISKDLAQQELDFRTQLDDNFKAGLQDRAKAIAESFTPFKVAGSMVDAVYNDMGSALDKFVETGKLSFSDLARSIIIDLEKIALKSAVIGVFKAMGIGDIFSLPGKAAGGPVNAGQAYMVGEGGGPEMFIPNTSGTIVPNNRLGSSGGMGGNTYITNNISAIDSRSVSQLFAEHRQTLFGNVEQARRELPLRTR